MAIEPEAVVALPLAKDITPDSEAPDAVEKCMSPD